MPESTPAPGLWQLLRHSRFLLVLLAVCVVANFTSGGTFEVAMPALAHARYGASGYGAMIACFGGGALAGTLVAARMATLRRPAAAALGGFVIEGIAICLLPFLGGLPGAAAALAIAGLCNGFGNIVMVTLVQQWAPAQLLGRIMSLLTLAGFGTFPISVALAGFLVRHLQRGTVFPGCRNHARRSRALRSQPARSAGFPGQLDDSAGRRQCRSGGSQAAVVAR